MNTKSPISIEYAKDEKTSGLGMMIGQYLEQNLEEFETKVKQAQKLSIIASVEVENGISTTIIFSKNNIHIQNGVSGDTNLHLKGSWFTFADILSGKLIPFNAVMIGAIKMEKLPVTKPFNAIRLLSFLKIPDELIIGEIEAKGNVLTLRRALIWMTVLGGGAGIIYLFIQQGWM